MQTDFERIMDTTPLSEALVRMKNDELTCLVVVRGMNQVIGILTRTDMIKLRGSIVLKEGIVRDIVEDQNLIVVSPQDYIQDAARKLEDARGIDQLVVVELLNPVGLLSQNELIRWVFDEEVSANLLG